jgi:hypothetical protein
MAAAVELHSHARERAGERGVSEPEVIATVEAGERFRPSSAERVSEEISPLTEYGAASGTAQNKSKPLPSKKMEDGW